MKRVLACVLVLALVFGFSGCGEKEPVVEPLTAEDMAKYNVVEAFYKSSSSANCSVMAQAVADDGAYGMLGAVQYTDTDGNPSCISFVWEDKGMTKKISDENAFDVIPNSEFSYLGSGAVSLELRDRETDEVHTFIVTYSADENGGNEKIKVEKVKSEE